MVKSIQLKYCRIDYEREYGEKPFVVTHFPDGTSYGALPSDTKEYLDLADRCGYVDHWDWHYDAERYIWHYCIEHEIAHAVVAEYLYNEPSRVIWGCAHNKYASKLDILHEEELSVSLQAFARKNILPASSAPGFSWWKLRDKFYEVAGGPYFSVDGYVD